MKEHLLLGCIADDFTGASDAASFIAKSGMRTVLLNGVPGEEADLEADAVVIALKTRTMKTQHAVEESLEALEWLLKNEAEHIYIKYCSTFDSTPEGNIGPVLDAVLNRCRVQASILCPALPVNGRVVRDGKLYVNGILLAESSMKDHPLTPMWESAIDKLMKPQSKYPCVMLGRDQLRESQDKVLKYISQRTEGMEHYYIVPDYVEDEDACIITELFGNMKVLSGGSGILTELGNRYLKRKRNIEGFCTYTDGYGIVLAGSCSAATRKQIEKFQESGGYSYKIDPQKLMDGTENAEEIWETVLKNKGIRDILIYSSDEPDKVKQVQRRGIAETAQAIEKTLSCIAILARKSGYTRIVVAGGETSGAVTKALGYTAYYVGESIAPGVPVMIPEKERKVRLVLKSGNFGSPEFFRDALDRTKRA